MLPAEARTRRPRALLRGHSVSEHFTTVLILCTGNSVRSILGEAIFAGKGAGRIAAYSAGSKPKGVPHPGALRLLARKGIDSSAFRSKSWDEFTGPDAPRIDVAITVCGNAAGETCPMFLGAPLKAHWGLPDPADVTGDDAAVDAAFEETWRLLDLRVSALLALPFETMERDAFKAALAEIGEMEGAV
jgi:arsenate reductase (thioredoxin)